jgi:lysophospholipase L1-like esterase
MTTPAPVSDVRMLSLGDSYTVGEAVPAAESWPMQLAAILRARGIVVAAPTILARTGWTTGELTRGIDDANPSSGFDLVTLQIGVNDQFRGFDIHDYRNNVRTLLARTVGFANGRPSRVIVLSIPDWGVTPFADGRDRDRIARDIDAFNAVCREEAARAGAHWVDVTGVSRANADLVAADGLHPSARLYAEWSRLVLPEALAALR